MASVNNKLLAKPGSSCTLCRTSSNDELNLGFLYAFPDQPAAYHHFCLLFSSGLKQEGEDDEGILGFMPVDIKKEVNRGKRLHCAYCGKVGATVGCFNTKCRRSYHLPCGMKHFAQLSYLGEYRSWCVDHRVFQKGPGIDSICVCQICFENVKADPKEAIWAPCCKKEIWFHKNCMQRLAIYSGYFFKCPLCNDKGVFVRSMQQFGIYVPEKDANWELDSGAYEDLLERPSSCEAPICYCTMGREHDVEHTDWDIVYCELCGSVGIHKFCKKFMVLEKEHEWQCPECVELLIPAAVKERDAAREKRRKLEETSGSAAQEKDGEISTKPISDVTGRGKGTPMKELIDITSTADHQNTTSSDLSAAVDIQDIAKVSDADNEEVIIIDDDKVSTISESINDETTKIPTTKKETSKLSAIIDEESSEISVANNEASKISAIVDESRRISAANDESSRISAANDESSGISAADDESGGISAANDESGGISAANDESGGISAANDESSGISAANQETSKIPSVVHDESSEISATNEETLKIPSVVYDESSEISAAHEETSEISPAVCEEPSEISAVIEETSKISTVICEVPSKISAASEEIIKVSSFSEETVIMSSATDEENNKIPDDNSEAAQITDIISTASIAETEASTDPTNDDKINQTKSNKSKSYVNKSKLKKQSHSSCIGKKVMQEKKKLRKRAIVSGKEVHHSPSEEEAKLKMKKKSLSCDPLSKEKTKLIEKVTNCFGENKTLTEDTGNSNAVSKRKLSKKNSSQRKRAKTNSLTEITLEKENTCPDERLVENERGVPCEETSEKTLEHLINNQENFPEENSHENLNKRQVTNSEIPSNQSKQESNSISGRNDPSLEEHCSNIDFSNEIVKESLASERQTIPNNGHSFENSPSVTFKEEDSFGRDECDVHPEIVPFPDISPELLEKYGHLPMKAIETEDSDMTSQITALREYASNFVPHLWSYRKTIKTMQKMLIRVTSFKEPQFSTTVLCKFCDSSLFLKDMVPLGHFLDGVLQYISVNYIVNAVYRLRTMKGRPLNESESYYYNYYRFRKNVSSCIVKQQLKSLKESVKSNASFIKYCNSAYPFDKKLEKTFKNMDTASVKNRMLPRFNSRQIKKEVFDHHFSSPKLEASQLSSPALLSNFTSSPMIPQNVIKQEVRDKSYLSPSKLINKKIKKEMLSPDAKQSTFDSDLSSDSFKTDIFRTSLSRVDETCPSSPALSGITPLVNGNVVKTEPSFDVSDAMPGPLNGDKSSTAPLSLAISDSDESEHEIFFKSFDSVKSKRKSASPNTSPSKKCRSDSDTSSSDVSASKSNSKRNCKLGKPNRNQPSITSFFSK